jgi:hypothetical protein
MATQTSPSGTLRRVRTGLALAAAGVLLAACGSSSKSANTGGSISTAPSTSSSASASASSKASSGGGGSVNLGGGSFCDKARKAETDAASAASKVTDGPDALKQLEENAHSELTQLVNAAPSQIKAPVATLVSAENSFFDALSAANFDVTKVDVSKLDSFSTPQVMQAIDQIDSYLKGTCGINPSDSPS